MKAVARVRPSIDDMPQDFSFPTPAFPRTAGLIVERPISGASADSHVNLAEDFARAQQSSVMLGHGRRVARHTTVAQAIPREHRDDLALAVRRAAHLSPQRRATRLAPCPSRASDTPNAAEQIYSMLRDEIAIPALRRFERTHRADMPSATPMAGVSRISARAHATAATPPWFDDLLPHLRIEAQLLAQRGLSVDKVRHRLDALFRHEHPGVSWRATRIGLERDAFPFALGSTVLSVLADTTDPQRRLSMMWPPVEAMGVVLINLLGMARFNAAHPQWASRLARVTPTQALEAVNTMLRNPVRDVAAHVAGFVFCYGIVRNLARAGIEAGLSAALPGIMAYRFGNTIHSCLEILLCPIPGAFLGPIIDRIAVAPENARLEPLLQDRFADLICKMSDDMPATSATPFLTSFWHNFTGLLQSGTPKAIWLTLSLGFYFLSTFHGTQTPIHDDVQRDDTDFGTSLALSGNATQVSSTDVANDFDVDWHTQAVLSVLYGLIATFVSMQGISARHDAVATAYTRRRGRPKISTVTVTSQEDSGHSSTGSHSDLPDSPASPASPASAAGSAFPVTSSPSSESGDLSGYTSGDDAVFLPMDDTLSVSSSRETVEPRAAEAPPGRRHGTSVAPAGIGLPPENEDISHPADLYTPL
ncbi:hypothetical protein [Pandoraea sp. ISTKB]|uniref:hypothetical protein n=1 Tax=Pandoraea sp. ISTKB TaxID=1586708 RepID=UPI000847594F|nr:hypothetical protein [Pandoraea sp. ISTKB]ODP32659.1 hypothetical protein A9762_21835 [Pandoraea sp. ISTKB]